MNTQSIPAFKILLVLPDGRIHKLRLGLFDISFREAPLTATMLAALVPPELPAHVEIADESIRKIPFHKQYDLVGISCMTGTSARAYQIADRFRAQGATVVLGGVHVTLLPDEARQHADAIIIRFAEISGAAFAGFCARTYRTIISSRRDLPCTTSYRGVICNLALAT